MDDLLDADFGKHDYDWLLTPPEAPLVPSLGEKDHQITPTASRGRSTRSASTARASRASASQLHAGPSTKPLRSSSVTHPSILNTHSSISINQSASIFVCPNSRSTRSASTARASRASASQLRNGPSTKPLRSSSARSSTPVSRSTTSRPSLTSRPAPARFQPPAKARPAPTSPAVKTTKSHNTRPQILSNSNPTATSSSPRLHSQSSTPTRKPINPLPTPIAGRTTSVGRARNPLAAATQPRSPSSRARAPVHPVDILDSPNAAPPNLRTKVPERAVSVGRVCPGAALTTHSNFNSQNTVSPSSKLRHALPVVNQSKFLDNSPKVQLKSYGHQAAPSQTQKSVVADGAARRSNKACGATESTGFGRNLSKMSLGMALRHMDIKQSIGGIKGTSLVPHSIRSNSRPKRISDPAVPVETDEAVTVNGSAIAFPDCNRSSSDFSPQQNLIIWRESNSDPHGSSRYDTMLLKEDSPATEI